jgi:putative transcriptional regulator
MRPNPLDYKISEINYLSPEKGRLLISEPFMPDPYFKRAVVLLVEHSEKGSLGFILNKSLEFKLNNTVKDFPDFDTPIFMGGPVEPDHLFYVHTKGEEVEDSVEITPGLYWTGNFEALKNCVKERKIATNEIRFFLGYSGWDAQQLDREISEDSWIISEPEPTNILHIPPSGLWRESLLSMGNGCVSIANFPEDPSNN